MLNHPLDRIPPGQLRRWQIPLSAIAVVTLAAGIAFVLPQREDFDLLALVEAGDANRAATVLAEWSPEDRVRVAYAVGFDFLVNPAYMSVLAIGCIWSGRRFASERSRIAASTLAWLAWSVVLANIVENIGLFHLLTATPTAPWPTLVAAAHYWASTVIVVTAAFSLAGLAGQQQRPPLSG